MLFSMFPFCYIWRSCATSTAANGNSQWQVRLYESSGVVEYIYGAINCTSTTYNPVGAGFSVNTTANNTASITYSTNTVSNAAVFSTNTLALGDVPNINSTTNGSRRIYRFTPPTTVNGDVTSLTFSSVNENGSTLNWIDNATNESGFLVTRSTNAGFTQNVATFPVASTTPAGTGSAYTSVQTGLSAGTTYFYKVVAVVEAGASTGITGNQSTLNGATYYWTGATGGAWSTFSNWNTSADGSGTAPTAWATSDVHIIDGEGTASGGALSISVDRTNFTIGQIKIVGNINLTLSSSAATTRTITVSGGPNEDFILEAGSTLNLTNANNAIAFTFSGSGNTGVIGGAYVASGSTSNNLTTTSGINTLVTVSSTGSITSNLNSISAAIVGSIPTLLFQNGSNYIHSNSTTTNYIPTATWQANATATLNGNTTGTSLTSNSTSLGNLVINMTASTATFSAFTSTARTISGNLTINNTGTGKFRAVTSGLLTIKGNLVINGGTFEVGSLGTGGIIVEGNASVATGAVLDVLQSTLQIGGNMINNGTVTSSETTTATSRINFIGTTSAQTFSGAGTFTARISSFGISNTLGFTLSLPITTLRVNMFSGTITGSSNITIGTGLALAAAVQVGVANNTSSGGTFDVAPNFNIGTGAYTLIYASETTPRTTGFEVPSTRSVTNLLVDNANGITLSGGNIEVVNILALTNGIVTTNATNYITHGSSTVEGSLQGGSATAYINGPIVRTIANANTGFVLFPVGKSNYSPISLSPLTTSVAIFKAEAFGSNTGTANPAIINLSANRRWETSLISGTFTTTKVRLADALIGNTNIPVQALAAAGAYTSSYGSTALFTAGTPNIIESVNAVNATDFTGFVSFATANVCSGTPNPGNTVSSVSTICLGESVNLSLQNDTAGSGVTYQWKSSADGIAYTNITNATSSTLTIVPTTITYYLAEVTCTASGFSAISSPVLVNFNNNITSITSAARCGVGTVALSVIGNTDSTINWYANATGGTAIASGNSFTTPSISNTTTYFAAAEGSYLGSQSIGLGALTSSSVGISFLSGGWGGVKTQYIIRASELIAAGIAPGAITSLGFEPTTSGQTYTGFSVNMAATTQNVMTTSFISSGLTQVYLGTLVNNGFLPIANTVNTLVFGTGTGSASSFVWNGTSNIVISISRSSVPNAGNSTASVMKYDATGFTSTAYDQADNLSPEAMLASTTADLTTSNRPKFIINGQLLCSSPRVAVVATVTSPPALTLSASNTTICSGTSSTAVTLTSDVANYDSYVWTPATGVSGNSTGWIFNPTVSTNYTLKATQSSGELCAFTTNFNVVVNPIPSAIIYTTTATEACLDMVMPLTVSGGTIANVSILEQNFNGATNDWTTTNASVGGTPSAIAWTLQNSPFNYPTYGPFTSNDASQFYISNNDAGGSGSIANTALISPSFSTLNYINAQLSFWHYFRNPGDAKVEYSIDNGVTWITLQTITVTTGTPAGFLQQNIALPAAAINKADVKVRFKYDTTGWQYFWAIDNVTVTGTQSTAITWNPITNLFSDAAGTQPYVAGTSTNTVYFRSNSIGSNNYTATSTTVLGCSVDATKTLTVLDCAIPYANLQFPGNSTIGTCKSQTYYARVYKADVTEAAGQGAGIQAWIGKNTTNTDPSTWSESSWQLATFNVQADNNDEYQITFAPLEAGTYYIASRFKFNPGAFVYGGYTTTGGGIWDGTNNVSSVLTVQTVATPTAATQSFCNSGTVANLVATGTGTINWYSAATGGNALTSTTALASGNYYASQTIDGCESARTMVDVTVNVTAAPTASAQSFCNSGIVADLVATGTGTINWYSAATGGNALTSTTALASGNYYASQTIFGCESTRTMVAVTVNVTTAPTASTQSFCNGATVADIVTSGTGTINWYNAGTGGTALTSTTALASGNYYASQTISGCESTRTLVEVIVNDLPVFTDQPFDTTVCLGESIFLSVSATGTNLTYQWFKNAVQIPGAIGAIYSIISTTLLDAGSYTVTVAGLCGTPITSNVAVVSVNTTNAPTGMATQDFTTGQTLADFVVNGQNLIWYSDATGTDVLPSITVLVSGVTYYASQTINGCESINRLAVTAGTDLQTPTFELSSLRYYPNPVKDILTVEYSEYIQDLQMYNMLGQLVYNRSTNTSKVAIDMSAMATGTYILQVTVKGITKNVKVIKKY